MKAAKEIGIEVAEVEIRKLKGLEFLLVERFDRIRYDKVPVEENNFTMERLLQEDFAQALGVQARNKYDVTIKDCVKVLNSTASPALSKAKFAKQVIFNYLIGNTDAHAKNFSLYWFF